MGHGLWRGGRNWFGKGSRGRRLRRPGRFRKFSRDVWLRYDVDSGWGDRRWRSHGSETFLKRGEFLLELVDTKSEFVKWKRFDSGFHSADGRKSGEGENRADEEKQNQNEEEGCHGGGAKRIRA